MKKILIALDYNPTAQKIAETGFSLAKAMNAQVVLLHVIADPVYYSSAGYSPIMGFGGYVDIDILHPNISEELKKESQRFLNNSKEYLGELSIQTLIKEGNVPDSIIEVSKEENIDIIVMGSHSRKWLEQIVMGSITERVLNQSSIPLYIIPTKKSLEYK